MNEPQLKTKAVLVKKVKAVTTYAAHENNGYTNTQTHTLNPT